jgi:hypothetical protein
MEPGKKFVFINVVDGSIVVKVNRELVDIVDVGDVAALVQVLASNDITDDNSEVYTGSDVDFDDAAYDTIQGAMDQRSLDLL